jgi:hypothetical protein
MEAVDAEAFLAWAADVGVACDPRYPNARDLGPVPPTENSRFWGLPEHPGEWPGLITATLAAIDPWAAGYLWPRWGRWPGWRPNERGTWAVILRGAGVPAGGPGAQRCRRGEEDEVVAVMFAALAFGGCVEDDVYFVPDHGRQVVMADSDGAVHVRCATEDRVAAVMRSMAGAGYRLPKSIPDGTFKTPIWMQSG